eukprot:5156331-Pyramimonas_sp.AAC.1
MKRRSGFSGDSQSEKGCLRLGPVMGWRRAFLDWLLGCSGALVGGAGVCGPDGAVQPGLPPSLSRRAGLGLRVRRGDRLTGLGH